MKLSYLIMDLPTGMAFAAATPKGIVGLKLRMESIVGFVEELEAQFGVTPVEDARPFKTLMKELTAYFSGEPVAFTVKLDVDGTQFQRRVWSELMKIPYGNVRSYKWLAAKAGSPMAARAVGGALHANRVPIVIPCHRVIEASGGLGGYGGGLDIKRRLLELEGVLPFKGLQ
jgi:methylated-DNA-[protein]-cysteine S-methyltransferase